MRVLVAPDAFKESLSPVEAAEAIAAGLRRAAGARRFDIEINQCPLSDGGEGFVEAVVANRESRVMASEALDPMGRRVPAAWALLREPAADSPAELVMRSAGKALVFGLLGVVGDERIEEERVTGVIESAGACGLSLVPPDMRDPERASSAGLGELIAEALDHDCNRVVVGLGGSATVDGGIGCLHALGARFRDEIGRELGGTAMPPTGADLSRVQEVDLSSLDPRLSDAQIICACDVDNPLLGPEGAARVYGPQKGANPEQVERLEAGLERMVACARRAGYKPRHETPGAGAAGGLGFALATFLGAELASGAEVVLAGVGFERRCLRCNLVVTGEGRIDAQSARGKAAFTVARRAAELGLPTIAIGGRVSHEARAMTRERGGPYHAVWSSAPEGMDEAEALERAGPLLEETAALAFDAWLRAR